jgi:Xaa-Pro aminopeptidase
MRLEVSKAELNCRKENVLKELKKKDLDALCLFDPHLIFYLTNFKFIPTERPMAYLLTLDKEFFFVPELEEDHIKFYFPDVAVKTYPEYPGLKHPMDYLRELFFELNLTNKTIGVDSDGAPAMFGYSGPKISKIIPKAEIKTVSEIIKDMMVIKSQEEIELLRESAKWANLTLLHLQEYTKPGLTENEISLMASTEATLAMVKTYGEKDKTFKGFADFAFAGFRGQIGKHSVYPHALTRNTIIRKGDVLGTGSGPVIGGYQSELERTFIVGKPTKEQEKYFKLMCEVQEIAFKAIKPGAKCSNADEAVMKFFKDHNLMDYWKHHTGHSIGLQGHEPPFLDVGDHTVMQPGMVFTVEPGIYVSEVGGFRHSDTVLVTKEGMEILTYYPRDLKSLIIK